MPKILAASHALPSHSIEQADIREAVGAIFSSRIPALDMLRAVFDHARIDRRQLMRPLSWYAQRPAPLECNRIYREEGLALLREAAEGVLRQTGLPATAIDQVLFVSSTGLATPTLDSYLINSLGLSPQTSRMPIWGLGCAAGAVALARAADYCRAWPRANVLVLALECCSLTFMAEDASKKNLVGTAIFGDGAAAALVAGDQAPGSGPRIRAARSHLFPDSYQVMGWDFLDAGMALVLSPRLPAIIRREVAPLVHEFLAAQGLTRRDLRHFVTHPGGAKVIDAYREALELVDSDLALTEEVLRTCGNISSASVLVVLEKWLATKPQERPGHGLLSAFGPGFSAELLLLEV
jgi:alkylresorcinol/alkylpyrone synthase